jgi:hypothetical protein
VAAYPGLSFAKLSAFRMVVEKRGLKESLSIRQRRGTLVPEPRRSRLNLEFEEMGGVPASTGP